MGRQWHSVSVAWSTRCPCDVVPDACSLAQNAYARREDVVLILCELRAVVITGGPEPAREGRCNSITTMVAIYMLSSKPMTPYRRMSGLAAALRIAPWFILLVADSTILLSKFRPERMLCQERNAYAKN